MKRFLRILIILLILIYLVSILNLKSGIEAKNIEFSTTATVTVNPIYSLDIEIEILKKFVRIGENLSILVELEKIDLTETRGEIEVRLDYEILKKKGKEFGVITRGDVSSLNVTNETKKIIEIQVPSNIKFGRYILKIKASHPQAYGDEDEDNFFVIL